MITLALNILSSILYKTKPMMISVGGDSLKCRIVEITEQQNYGLPNNPIDSGQFVSDTIYTMPKTLSVRVFVKSEDLDNFISSIENGNLSQDLFEINSMYEVTYKNMKIVSYSRDLNSSMIGAMYFNLQFQEVILVDALAENFKSSSKAGYSPKKDLGNKVPQEKPKSVLYDVGWGK